MIFLIAPIEALTDPRLTDQERRVLLSLYSFRNRNADTVWPSLQGIAERANIADVPRISKITAKLEKKGWLSKKKRGWGSQNIYSLNVPESVPPCDGQNDASERMLAKNTILANFTKSILVSDTKNNKQQKNNKERIGEVETKSSQNTQSIEYKKIVDSYNEILGNHLRKVRELTEQRKKHIRARIQDDPKRTDLDWWKRYFEFVSHSEFLMGEGPDNPATGKPWAADFDWLTNQTNMTKTLERKYHAG